MMTEVFESKRLNERYEKSISKCGLTVYLSKKDFSSYYASLTVKYGSLYNQIDFDGNGKYETVPDGIAHFIEHKLFANKDGTDAMTDFAKYGANANAYTTTDHTSYLFSCTENFEENLGVLLDFVFKPYFTKKNVTSERKIINEEIRMYDDSPQTKLYFNNVKSLYSVSPLRVSACGTEKSIAEIDEKLLKKCYDAFYEPKNMFLTVSGNTDMDTVISLVDKYVEANERKACKSFIYSDRDKVQRRRYTEKADISVPMILFGFKYDDIDKAPLEREKFSCAISMAGNLLFGPSSEFYYNLYQNNEICDDISCNYEYGEGYSFAGITTSSTKIDVAEKKIVDYISSFSVPPFSEKDFIRAKRLFFSEFLRDYDSSEYIAENLVMNVCANINVFDIPQIIDEIDYNYIKDCILKLYNKDNMAISVLLPKGE